MSAAEPLRLLPAQGRPLTVAYVLKMFPRFSETFILNELLALERLGVRTVVFSMKPPDHAERQPGFENLRARVHIIPPLDASWWRTHLACHLESICRAPHRYVGALVFALTRGSRAARDKFAVAPYVACMARREGAEHLHAHFASGPARQAKLASMIGGLPYSFTAHARDLYWSGHRHGRNRKLKKRVQRAAFVIAISECNRKFLLGLGFKVPRRRIVVIYNGLNLETWAMHRPRGRPLRQEGPPLVLAVGRLVEKKGFDVLLDGCAILARRGTSFRCAIAGEGPERARLERRIEALGLGDIVRLEGGVRQDVLKRDHYARAHTLVQPSVVAMDGDMDGIPTVVLEAMSVGLPVVSTPVSGIGEAIDDGESGLLVRPGDPVALADAIERVIEDDVLAARLTAAARRRIEERFDLHGNVKAIANLFAHSARGARRWSDRKVRERMGLEAPAERVEAAG
jgi:glycosyltransferase involved in cell wall biosynthesis